MSNVITNIGHNCIEGVLGLGRIINFQRRIFYWMFTTLPKRRILIPMMLEVGVHSLPVVLATGAFVGMVLAVQMFSQLDKFGAENTSGMIIAFSMLKEFGPVLTAVVLAGRVGGAITAELGTMRVTEQLDALTAMGANPIRRLVVPRFLAILSMTPVLTVFSAIIGILGGWLVCTQALGGDSFYYWDHAVKNVGAWDVGVGMFKSFFFGALIGMISSYRGFHCDPGAEGVGRATTQAFVATFISILVSNFFLAVLLRQVRIHFID